MRQKLYEMVNNEEENSPSQWYNRLLFLAIMISVLPLMTKKDTPLLLGMDYFTAAIFSLDYGLRLLTADFTLKKGWLSFIIYPFTFLAILDLVCILPTFYVFNNSLKLLKITRMSRTLRVFRVVRYSRNITILTNVMKKQKEALLLVAYLALSYIVVTAILIFNVEPNTFENFFDAIYWATISLTTVGYGDIYAVTPIGRMITMLSSLLGIAIVALPAGIITAGYMTEIVDEVDMD